MKTIILLFTGLFLAGCLGKMEKITEDTKDQVAATNRKLEEAHELQAAAAALLIVINKANPEHIRITAAKTVIRYSNEDRLLEYLGGAPGNFRSPYARRPSGQTVYIPNVSYVGDLLPSGSVTRTNSDDVLGINPIGQDNFDIWRLTLYRMSADIHGKSTDLAGLSAPELAEFKIRLDRITHAATIVAGASDVHQARSISSLSSNVQWPNRAYLADSATRGRIAREVFDANRNAGMDAESLAKLSMVIQARTGIAVR